MCFPDAPRLGVPTYADYGRPTHPWVFESAQEIRETLFTPEDLFVRKIKHDAPHIIDALAENYDAQSRSQP